MTYRRFRYRYQTKILRSLRVIMMSVRWTSGWMLHSSEVEMLYNPK